MSEQREILINVPVLARVEGEGALDLNIRNGAIESLQLKIYEPPRLFEKFLEGRSYREVPDAVARICGICPVAYQMSAVHAIESIFAMDPGLWVRAMRRVFYCGEWIESHSLHIHLLAAPDYFGCGNVAQLAERFPDEVRRGLRLQGLGNDIIRFLGARSVHPVGARVGGFHHAPDRQQAEDLRRRIENSLPDARALIQWVSGFDIPAVKQDFEYVSLRHPDEYPMNEGRLVSNRGLDLSIADFEAEFAESQAPYSTALHSLHKGMPYLVGPLARLNHNLDKLPPEVQDAVALTNIAWPSLNPYHSMVARAVEIYYAMTEVIRLLKDYHKPDSPYVEARTRSGTGFGCTEAPRGMLWHRYELNESGDVMTARIVPPTSQNQARIEEDLRQSLMQFGLDHSEQELRLHAETVIRNYDPCISCSTHFLDLRVNRE
jgi:sulfhydrogenase subunit alpha